MIIIEFGLNLELGILLQALKNRDLLRRKPVQQNSLTTLLRLATKDLLRATLLHYIAMFTQLHILLAKSSPVHENLSRSRKPQSLPAAEGRGPSQDSNHADQIGMIGLMARDS